MNWTKKLNPRNASVGEQAQNFTAREQLEAEARQVDVSFKVVRFGLNFIIAVLLLLGFCLFYVGPADGAFYAILLTFLVCAGALVALVFMGRRAKTRYFKVTEKAKSLAAPSSEDPFEETA